MLTFQIKKILRELGGLGRRGRGDAGPDAIPFSSDQIFQLLPGDHSICDHLVGLLRDDILLHQIAFLSVRTAVNDLLRMSFANSGQADELGL